jgi:hypothetical protein
MKFRITCPDCRYKFVVAVLSRKDCGEATCPQTECRTVFKYRGPDAPKAEEKDMGKIFEDLFGSHTPGQSSIFDNLFNKHKKGR